MGMRVVTDGSLVGIFTPSHTVVLMCPLWCWGCDNSGADTEENRRILENVFVD